MKLLRSVIQMNLLTVKFKKEIRDSFAITPQTTNTMTTLHDKYEKASH